MKKKKKKLYCASGIKPLSKIRLNNLTYMSDIISNECFKYSFAIKSSPEALLFFGKLFTSVLNNRLNKFSDQYHVILENQGGFRKGYSTNDNLFILHIVLESNLYQKSD
jgi:hypothetical protein